VGQELQYHPRATASLAILIIGTLDHPSQRPCENYSYRVESTMNTSSVLTLKFAGKLKYGLALRRRNAVGESIAELPAPDPSLDSLMESMVSADERPFLVAQHREQRDGLVLDREDIRVGEVIRHGAFTETYEISRCPKLENQHAAKAGQPVGSQIENSHDSTIRQRTSFGARLLAMKMVNLELAECREEVDESPSKGNRAELTRQYTLKCLHPCKEFPDDEHDPDPLRRTKELLLEAMYLSVLDHPSIITLHAFPNPSGTQVFLITDRCDETLEDRFLLWRRMRRERREKEVQHYKNERKRIERHNRQKTRKSSNESMHQYNQRQKHVRLLRTPTPFKEEVESLYPADLIALSTNYALQIASALEYLHARGIVVCNLRPDTIGFKTYPHHHEVKIMDLTATKELPMDQEDPSLPATEAPQKVQFVDMDSNTSHRTGTSDSTAVASACGAIDDFSSTSFSTGNSLSSPFAKPTSKIPTRAARRSDAHSTLPDSSSSASHGSDLDGSASQHKRISNLTSLYTAISPVRWSDIIDGSATQHALTSMFHQRPSSGASLLQSYKVRRNYRAPELYVDLANPEARFNAKVDSFSLAVIFYELLAEKRAFPPNAAISDQDHLRRIRVEKLRPPLQQCSFPLTIQEILRQSWLPDVSKRWDSSQIVQSLTRILPVLEGHGLKHGVGSSAKQRRYSTNTIEPLTLPERAAKVVHSKAAQGWEQVRNTTKGRVFLTRSKITR
jgi:serine/threonine protein kinase